jgi:hypothetical protein
VNEYLFPFQGHPPSLGRGGQEPVCDPFSRAERCA